MDAPTSDEITPCYYCGSPASGIDHVIPLHLISKLDDEDARRLLVERRRKLTVPCCSECNGLLSGRYFDTLAERTAHLKGRLRAKHRHDLATPDWNSHELMSIALHLRNYVLASIVKRDELRKRLSWQPGTPEWGRDAGQVMSDARRRKSRDR